MAHSVGQRLFQIQCQVGWIKWEGQPAEGTVCVTFQVLDYPPVEVCSTEFCADCMHQDSEFKSGKMILFALSQQSFTQLHNNFVIKIKVIQRTLKAGRLPFRTELASAEMNLGNDFSAILSTCFQPQAQYPASKFINDELELTRNDSVVGVMNTFVRLTSLGGTFMGRMYAPDVNSNEIIIETDNEAQALITESHVKACPKRYVTTNTSTDVNAICREYAARSEDDNMLAVRLYKLDKKQEAKSGVSIPPLDQEPDSVIMKGQEIKYEPDPEFSKPDNPTSVYYRMTSNISAPYSKQVLQYIEPPTEEPVTSIGPITGLPPDGKVDVFVLAIGNKKYDQVLKTHLEVEVRTPKYVSRKKERFYQSTQYDKNDLTPSKPKKSKSKPRKSKSKRRK